MIHRADEVFSECLKQFLGTGDSSPLSGSPEIRQRIPDGGLSGAAFSILNALAEGDDFPPEAADVFGESAAAIAGFYNRVRSDFPSFYDGSEGSSFFRKRAKILFEEEEPVKRARAISELWLPDLVADDDLVLSEWKLYDLKENPAPYSPDQLMLQLNALYTLCGNTAPEDAHSEMGELAADYEAYVSGAPGRIAVYDHPVPIFTNGRTHELESCLAELNADIAFEKSQGVLPHGHRMPVLISISTTHEGLDHLCERWLAESAVSWELDNLDCFILSENKARTLDKILGEAGGIFTVQGKYACHFGALKYAQLIFERAYGIRAGFKLDTDEGIHSRDMLALSGKTWLQQLCHPLWGGTARTAAGETVRLGFNIGEYVDSRDLDSLGYDEAVFTPEVKTKDDLRGPFLLFNKGAVQAKGTALYNRSGPGDPPISHPLVKGGGYGIDNFTLRAALPVGFSMVGRAEDQQFYFSALKSGVRGVFNPLLRIIHYKDAVAGLEHKAEAGRNTADIYRMLLFRELMLSLDVVELTRPFPAIYAGELAPLQAFILWIYFIYRSSARGREDEAREYLSEGMRQLIPLLSEIDEGLVMKRFEKEREAWRAFADAASELPAADARAWADSMRLN